MVILLWPVSKLIYNKENDATVTCLCFARDIESKEAELSESVEFLWAIEGTMRGMKSHLEAQLQPPVHALLNLLQSVRFTPRSDPRLSCL